MSLPVLYLKNLAKRAIKGEQISQSEIVHFPRVLDKTLGDGDGVLTVDDIDDILSNIGEEIVDKVTDVIDFFTSII